MKIRLIFTFITTTHHSYSIFKRKTVCEKIQSDISKAHVAKSEADAAERKAHLLVSQSDFKKVRAISKKVKEAKNKAYTVERKVGKVYNNKKHKKVLF